VEREKVIGRKRLELTLTQPFDESHERRAGHCAVQGQAYLMGRRARETGKRLALPNRALEHQVHALARTLDQPTLCQRLGQAPITRVLLVQYVLRSDTR